MLQSEHAKTKKENKNLEKENKDEEKEEKKSKDDEEEKKNRDDKKNLVGKKFSSFEELSTFMKAYQQKEKQLFPVDKSLYVKEEEKSKHYNEKLVYSLIVYSCKFGPRFRSRGKGQRQCR